MKSDNLNKIMCTECNQPADICVQKHFKEEKVKTNNTRIKDYKTAIEAYIEIWKHKLPKEAIKGLRNIIENL